MKKTLLTLTAAGAFASTTLASTASALAGPLFAPPDPCSLFGAFIHCLSSLL